MKQRIFGLLPYVALSLAAFVAWNVLGWLLVVLVDQIAIWFGFEATAKTSLTTIAVGFIVPYLVIASVAFQRYRHDEPKLLAIIVGPIVLVLLVVLLAVVAFFMLLLSGFLF